jgi:predicted metal-dependent hydrolase
MNKGERISRFVAKLGAEDVDLTQADIAKHPFYRAFFRCWNEQHYYKAHDVLEQLWLNTDSGDADFFKGLIQAAGAFVHLQKRFDVAALCQFLRAYADQIVASDYKTNPWSPETAPKLKLL